jgi:succinate dehydrogenase / fumarate reductase, flavoprotein subunit
MWEKCGMARTKRALKEALAQIPPLREEFWKNVKVPGKTRNLNQSLEQPGAWPIFRVGRAAARRADRDESCGGHFREEFTRPRTANASATTSSSPMCRLGIRRRRQAADLNKEPLVYEEVH